MSWSGTMSTVKLSKTKEITTIALLSAVNIASRIYLQFLPNFKPVTSIIIISVMVFGLAFALKLTVVTTLVSNLYLGMGIWTFFQILAWFTICLLTLAVKNAFVRFHKEPNLLFMAIFAFFMGYVFGFVVSLDVFLIGGPVAFWTYYIAGLLFDTYHAVGNLFFYFLCAPIIQKIFIRKGKELESH